MPIGLTTLGQQYWGQDLDWNTPAPLPFTGTASPQPLIPALTLPGGFFYPGVALRATIYGNATPGGAAANLIWGCSYGGTALYASNSIGVSTATPGCFRYITDVLCVDSSTLMAQGWMWYGPSLNANPRIRPLPAGGAQPPAEVTGFDFTQSAVLAFTMQCPATTTGSVNCYTLESVGA